MNTMKRLSVAAVVLAIAASAVLAAADVKLDDLLGALPNKCMIVWGSPDVPAAVAAVRRWSEPVLAVSADPKAKAEIDKAVAAIRKTLTGPAVGAWLGGDEIVFLAATTGTQADIVNALRPYTNVRQEHDLVVWPGCYCAVRDGRIVCSNKADTVRQFLGSGPDTAQSVLGTPDGAALLTRREVRDASFFVFKRPGLPKELDPLAGMRGAGPAMALQRRLADALAADLWWSAPGVVSLDLGKRAITVKAIALSPLDDPPARPPARANPLRYAAHIRAVCPLCLWGSGAGFASAVDGLGIRMERFDPDVAAEFREEMAELNRDLGYDFQRGFLGTLGSDWAVGVLPSGKRKEAEWVFACALKDSDKFIRNAARLAEISKEPWSEARKLDGVRLFNTRAFTVPLAIAVSGDSLLIAPSAHGRETIINLLKKASPRPDAPGTSHAPDAVWEIHAVARWLGIAQLLQDEKGVPREFREAWSRLPQEARFVLNARRAAQELRIELRLELPTLEDAREWLAPLSTALIRARENGRRAVCMSNISQMLRAVIMYESANKRFPARLRDLMPAYIDNARLFQCPSAARRMGPEGKPLPSYRFVGNLATLQRFIGPETIFIYDIKGNHPGGRNVGHFDGHVKWYDEADFQQALARSYKGIKDGIAWAKKQGRKISVDMKKLEAFHHDRPMPGK